MANSKEWPEGCFTVGALLDKLAELPREAYVVLSSDAEGNDYHPMSDFSREEWISQGYGGELGEDPDEENNCVVFWPL